MSNTESVDIVRTPDTVATLPVIRDSADLLRQCAASGAIGVIAGPPGSGKTVALRRLAARYSAMDLPGNAHLMCCQSNVGPTRGVRDVLFDIGVGGNIVSAGSAASLQMLIKVAARDFVRKDIRCLLLDESDRWSSSAFAGVLSMTEALTQNGHPVSIIAVSMYDEPAWAAESAALASRTLRVLRAAPASPGEMISLLGVWSEDFADFAANPDQELAHRICEHVAGDLRRLNFFVRLHDLDFKGQCVTRESIEATLANLDPK